MHAISVRPVARRLAVSLAAAAVTTVIPTSAQAAPEPATSVATKTAPTLAEAFQAEIGQAVRTAQHRVEVQERRAAARRAAEEAARSQADKIMDLAAREAGDPYVWGASGPSAFDCSGYTMYVFDQLGISLPHSSRAQAAMSRRVSDPQVGDLVFFGGSNVYHVGIYAGDGYMWHAPRTGDVVKKAPIWTGDVFYGRVG